MRDARDQSGAESADEAGVGPSRLTLGNTLSAALRTPSSPTRDAASGDVNALRALAEDAYERGIQADGLTRLILIIEALTFSRLAGVASGQDDDLERVVFLYGAAAVGCRELGDLEAGDEREAIGVALANAAADDGNEDMAQLLVRSGSLLSPKVIQQAQATERLRSVAPRKRACAIPWQECRRGLPASRWMRADGWGFVGSR